MLFYSVAIQFLRSWEPASSYVSAITSLAVS